MIYIANAFSISMLLEENSKVTVSQVAKETVQKILIATLPSDHVISGIGHAPTARIVSDMLEYPVVTNRINIQIDEKDILLVAQYCGTRLPEGATELPEGAEIKFFKITVSY